MILAVDVGNMNIVVGVLKDEKVILTERISTSITKTELEYAIDLKNILDLHGMEREEMEGGIISSVVPQITGVVGMAVEKLLDGKRVYIVGPGVKTGLHIGLDNPAEVGADCVAEAVAATAEYKVPLVIVDLGTATTFSVVDENKKFLGGMILPGVSISLDALTNKASQLGGIGIEPPKTLIGRNTIESMRSGILYGSVGAIDGIVERIEAELGSSVTVIASGGLAGLVTEHLKHDVIWDDDLLLKGLGIIYRKNQKK